MLNNQAQQNSNPSLFSESFGTNNQDNDIDSRFQNRQEQSSNAENFSQIIENTMTNELSLGKKSRDKIFMQRRLKKNMNVEQTQNLKNKLTIPVELFENCNNMTVQRSKFTEIIDTFRQQDIAKKYYGLVGIRKLLSLNPPPIQELIDIGITSELIELLNDNTPAEFQYESLWCLTNIAAGTSDQANNIVVKGGIPKFLKLMDSSIEELKLQASWIIGNLASDCNKIRDTLLKEKAFDKLITILASTNNIPLIKSTTWSISNFFRVKPAPPFDKVKKCIKMVSRAMVIIRNDNEFLTDACFILSYMTEHYKDTINELLDIEIIPLIIKSLDIDDQFIQLSCLRVVGNIASGNANQTQKLIDWGVLDYLKKTLFNPKKSIRKESAWILSNIAAGTQKQIENLINEDFLLIFEKVIQNDESEVRKECIWAMCNLTSVKNPNYIKKILQQGILECIKSCLMINDAKNLAVNLEALNNLLFFGKQNKINNVNPVAEEIERLGMIDLLENLQSHPVEIVYEKTLKLLLDYFDVQYNE